MACGHVGILTVNLHLPEGGSLKHKRKELLRVRSTLERRGSCSVAEVDHHDLWQRSRLSVAVVDRTPGGAAERIDALSRLVNADPVWVVSGETREWLDIDCEPWDGR